MLLVARWKHFRKQNGVNGPKDKFHGPITDIFIFSHFKLNYFLLNSCNSFHAFYTRASGLEMWGQPRPTYDVYKLIVCLFD